MTALRELGYLTTAERIELNYVKGTRGMTIQCNMEDLASFPGFSLLGNEILFVTEAWEPVAPAWSGLPGALPEYLHR